MKKKVIGFIVLCLIMLIFVQMVYSAAEDADVEEVRKKIEKIWEGIGGLQGEIDAKCGIPPPAVDDAWYECLKESYECAKELEVKNYKEARIKFKNLCGTCDCICGKLKEYCPCSFSYEEEHPGTSEKLAVIQKCVEEIIIHCEETSWGKYSVAKEEFESACEDSRRERGEEIRKKIKAIDDLRKEESTVEKCWEDVERFREELHNQRHRVWECGVTCEEEWLKCWPSCERELSPFKESECQTKCSQNYDECSAECYAHAEEAYMKVFQAMAEKTVECKEISIIPFELLVEEKVLPEEVPPEEVPECTDTDGGKDIYTKGICTDRWGRSNTDDCTSSSQVGEYYCGYGQCLKNTFSCPSGICSDGACTGKAPPKVQPKVKPSEIPPEVKEKEIAEEEEAGLRFILDILKSIVKFIKGILGMGEEVSEE